MLKRKKTRRKIKLLAVLVILFFAVSSISARQKKDPFLAGVLSWSWTGLGQFYAQDYTSGSLFLTANLLQTGGLVFLLFNYSERYTDTSKGDRIVEWKEISSTDQFIVISFVIASVLLKGWAVYDAVLSAENYNKKHFGDSQSRLLPEKVDLYYARRRGLKDKRDSAAEETNNVGVSYSF